MSDHATFNVLFLCTGNACRSIIAEAILNVTGGRRAFAKVCREIKNRLDIFAMLPFEKLSRMAAEEALDALGRQVGGSADLPG